MDIRGFTLVEPPYKGGMALVYKGTKNHLRRAFKILKPDAAANNPKLSEQFLKEISIQSQLDHPNIVKIIDAYPYTLADNRTVTVLEMEWLDGSDLMSYITDTLSGRPMELQEVRRIALSIVDAMEYAHSNNILHLDLKPSNVFRTVRGDIKIIDFGIARVVGENASIVEGAGRYTMCTSFGQTSFKGTAGFASPEQSFPEATLNFTSDIYSFGCTIHYLLTAKTDLNVEISDPIFAAIVDKCTRQKQRDRYSSFSEIRAAIGGNEGGKIRCSNPQCGREIDAQFSFCPYCRTEIVRQVPQDGPMDWSQLKFCPHCGSRTPRAQRVCVNCHKDTSRPDDQSSGAQTASSAQSSASQSAPNWDSQKYCPHCGQLTPRVNRMCVKCGKDTTKAETSTSVRTSPHGVECLHCHKLNWVKPDGKSHFCIECGRPLPNN